VETDRPVKHLGIDVVTLLGEGARGAEGLIGCRLFHHQRIVEIEQDRLYQGILSRLSAPFAHHWTMRRPRESTICRGGGHQVRELYRMSIVRTVNTVVNDPGPHVLPGAYGQKSFWRRRRLQTVLSFANIEQWVHYPNAMERACAGSRRSHVA
jgi:hypothetical protein